LSTLDLLEWLENFASENGKTPVQMFWVFREENQGDGQPGSQPVSKRPAQDCNQGCNKALEES
jgi:hypothetical protein